jgi:uncharacterized membrane protein YjgN (DUF898 family)
VGSGGSDRWFDSEISIQMMQAIIIIGLFFLMLMIGNTMLVFHLRDMMVKRNEHETQDRKQIKEELQSLKLMFKGDIKDILNHVKQIIK